MVCKLKRVRTLVLWFIGFPLQLVFLSLTYMGWLELNQGWLELEESFVITRGR